MLTAKEYRAEAQKCRQMADKIISPLDREMWLQLAADWLRMAALRERSAIEQFDAQKRDRGANRTKSESEH
jgi:hypothetical protein